MCSPIVFSFFSDDPFVRGAEFWQVHDLILKMILTGMLIYIPPTSRAAAGNIVCLIGLCTLNYFQPHKNKICFWLSQVSFITTALKYIIALLLSASTDTPEMKVIGSVLTGLDISFFACTMAALCASIHMIRVKIKKIEQQEKDALEHGESTSDDRNNSVVQVVPISGERKVTDEEESRINNSSNDTTSTADKIHANFVSNERHLHEHSEIRRGKSMRNTQARVDARLLVRQTKTLNKTTMFAKLNEINTRTVLTNMEFCRYQKDDIICSQGEEANIFYIIVSGQCSVTKQKGDSDARQISVLSSMDMFGESCLIGEHNTRNATVTVKSLHVQILQLDNIAFNELVESGVVDHEAKKQAMKLAEMRAYDTRQKEGMVAVHVREEENVVDGSGGGEVKLDTIGGNTNSSSSRSLFSP